MAVECRAGKSPVFLRDGQVERLYIRTGASSTELSASQTQAYIKQRFFVLKGEPYQFLWRKDLDLFKLAEVIYIEGINLSDVVSQHGCHKLSVIYLLFFDLIAAYQA